MTGWISLHRQLQDHWLWKDSEPFDKRSAWVDLLLLANHDDAKIPYKGKIVTCRRGEVNRSILWLADRWGWSRNKVRRFLELLKSDNMIELSTTTHETTITIVNYSFFQDPRPTKRATNDTTDGATGGQPADIYNKDNKNNKSNNTIPTTTNLSNIEAPEEPFRVARVITVKHG